MKRSTAQKMGGIDQRFHGAYWGYDQLQRLVALGNIKFKVCARAVVTEDERAQNHGVPKGRRLSHRYGRDQDLWLSLWIFENNRPTKRKDAVQYYSNDELIFTVEFSQAPKFKHISNYVWEEHV